MGSVPYSKPGTGTASSSKAKVAKKIKSRSNFSASCWFSGSSFNIRRITSKLASHSCSTQGSSTSVGGFHTRPGQLKDLGRGATTARLEVAGRSLLHPGNCDGPQMGTGAVLGWAAIMGPMLAGFGNSLLPSVQEDTDLEPLAEDMEPRRGRAFVGMILNQTPCEQCCDNYFEHIGTENQRETRTASCHCT